MRKRSGIGKFFTQFSTQLGCANFGIGKPLPKGKRRRDRESGHRRSLRMESLEDRNLLAVFFVNHTDDVDDDGIAIPGSLRKAIELANATDDADTIVFSDFIFTHPTSRVSTPQTIDLEDGGTLVISNPVRILGPGPRGLTILAAPDLRVFDISATGAVEIGGMTIVGGVAKGGRGGAIQSTAELTLTEVVLRGNSAELGGGAIYAQRGSLTINRSLIGPGNSSEGGGGGIFLGNEGEEDRPVATINNSTITGNTTVSTEDATGFGGGIFNRNGTLSIRHSTISQNIGSFGFGVATYGVEDPAEDPLIVTNIDHSIIYGNDLIPGNLTTAQDIGAVRLNRDGDAIVPRLNIQNYNIIGQIADAKLFNTGANFNGNFYQVVSAPEGIDWPTANLAAGTGSSHLVTIAGNPPSGTPRAPDPRAKAENDFVAALINDPLYWKEFAPTEPMAAPPPPQNIGPWMGGLQIDTASPAGGWAWVTDPVLAPERERFGFTNWAVGQPDDGALITEPPAMGEPPMLPPEDRLAYFTADAMVRGGTWGDLVAVPDGAQLPIAYVIEFEKGTNMFGVDPKLLPLAYHGGATSSYYLASNSPAIDAGDPEIGSPFSPPPPPEQRGRHFSRVSTLVPLLPNQTPVIDIGATEIQKGEFFVDHLFDENDGQYAGILRPSSSPLGSPVPFVRSYLDLGDFGLREAVSFSEANPEVDTILFSQTLVSAEDPAFSADPTLLLKTRQETFSAIRITQPVNIEGPSEFRLEVDVSGADPTPTVDNFDGARALLIDDLDSMNEIEVNISNLTFLGGDVISRGGAILSREKLNLSLITFAENAASTDGGAVAAERGTLVVESSTFTNNFAARDGGAVYVGSGNLTGNARTATISNSTLSANRAGNRGGAVHNGNTDLQILYSTITLNTSGSTRGGGVATINGPSAKTHIQSSIIVGNANSDVEYLNGAANTTITSGGYNLIGTGNATTRFNQPGDVIGVASAGLAPLAFNGGRNKTHRLLPGSMAIDRGDPAAIAGAGGVPLLDERDELFTRVFDGDQNGTPRIDIGAYELQANVFIVDTSGNGNDGNISSGNFSLREAIEAANLNPLPDTIEFAPFLAGQGISLGGGQIDITDSLTIQGLGDFVTILNGFGGGRWLNIDDNNANRNIVVNIRDLTFRDGNSGAGPGGVIRSTEDLSISNATFINNGTVGAFASGGALYQREGSLLLDNVVLTGNSTNGVAADGGAVFALDSDVTIQFSTISGNSTLQTQAEGGGVYLFGGSLTVRETTFTGNSTPGGNSDGGGLAILAATGTIEDSIISGNFTTGSNSEGGGVLIRNSNVVFDDTVISLNYTTGTQSSGGGIYVNGGSVQLNRATIAGNRTEGFLAVGGGVSVFAGVVGIDDTLLGENRTQGIGASGGAVYNSGGVVTLSDSTLSNNQILVSSSQGAGVYHNGTAPTAATRIVNSTLSNNRSLSQGGGVFNQNGLVQIQHSTITLNSVPNSGNGGGIASSAAGGATTQVQSSIVAGNLGGDVDRIGGLSASTFQSQGYNVVGVGLALSAFNASGDQTSISNPQLGPLVNNGGLTSTHLPLDNSPAINAGNPNAIAGSNGVPLLDQRGEGFARVRGGRIDVGAVESAFSAIPADFNSDSFVDGFDFLAWQRGFAKTNAAKSDGDANNDRTVNVADLTILTSTFGSIPAVGGPGPQGEAFSVAAAMAPPEESDAPFSAETAAPISDPQAARSVDQRPLFAQVQNHVRNSLRLLRPSARHGLADVDHEVGQRRLSVRPAFAPHRAVGLGEANIASRDAASQHAEFAREADALFDEMGRTDVL